MSFRNPPKFVTKIFSWFCHGTHLEMLEGDLFELFEERLQSHGYLRASLLYLIDVLTLIRPSVAGSFLINSKRNHMSIFNNYLKTAIRHLWKRKSFSAINLIGLTLGITSVLFIALYVNHENGFDQHISNSKNKYRIYNERHTNDGIVSYLPSVPGTFAQVLSDNFPQIEQVGRVFFDYDGSVFSVGERVFAEKNGVYAEPAALEVLDISLIKGTLSGLSEPQSILLSESTFIKFFGKATSNSQTIEVGGKAIQIAGVYKDFPKQGHLHPDYIFSFQTLVNRNPNRMKSWTMAQFSTYFELQEGIDLIQFETLFQDFVAKESRKFTTQRSYYYIPHFQEITKIHLNSSDFEGDIADLGNYQSLRLLSFAAGILLLIAVFNFINLTTAQLVKRAKEVGVRKFIGASRSQLLFQYITEACLVSLIGGAISLILVILLLPYFNAFSGKEFAIADILQPVQLLLFLSGLIVLGTFSGWYPAVLITRFQPMAILNGSRHIEIGTGTAKTKVNGRQLLVGTQYILSIGLILISLVIQRQFQFLQTRDMGFEKENLMMIELTPNMMQDLDATMASFSNFSAIDDVTFCFGVPGGLVASHNVVMPSLQEEKIPTKMFIVAPNYLTTMKMEIKAGRNFSNDLVTDVDEAFIVNEAAVANFGLGTAQEAIGKSMNWQIWGTGAWKKGKIVGVVKDFNFKSLHNQIGSVVMHIDPMNFSTMLVKIKPENFQAALSFVEDEYGKYAPNRPFEFEFVDQTFDRFYQSEQKLGNLFSLLTFLAIFTSVIGLYGLINHSIVSRSKELCIRKILGAATHGLYSLLVKQYFILAVVCLLIAAPLSYYFASQWLANFAFKVGIDSNMFLTVILSTLLLTFGIVGSQIFRVIRANPVETLRMD